MIEEREEVKQKAFENYLDSTPWPQNDKWHEETYRKIYNTVLKILNEANTNSTTVILNAGSGGTIYPTKGKIIHLDLIDTYIKKFNDYVVASIDNIPFPDKTFDIAICVGSVINYADYQKSIYEFARILKPRGKLIIEFERSNSGEFLFTKKHHKKLFLQKYNYNEQEHLLWLYNEKVIIRTLKYYGFSILKKQRFHSFSTLLNRFGLKEKNAAKYIKFDKILFPCSYFLAHNCILLAEKSLEK